MSFDLVGYYIHLFLSSASWSRILCNPYKTNLQPNLYGKSSIMQWTLNDSRQIYPNKFLNPIHPQNRRMPNLCPPFVGYVDVCTDLYGTMYKLHKYMCWTPIHWSENLDRCIVFPAVTCVTHCGLFKVPNLILC